MKKLYPYLLIWVFLACLTGCKDDTEEPVNRIETDGPYTEVGKQLYGSYSGDGIIVKGLGVKDYSFKGIILKLDEIKIDNEPTFQITLSTGSLSPEAEKYLKPILESFGIKPGEPFRHGKPTASESTFDDGSSCYSIQYIIIPNVGNDVYYINIKTDGQRLSLDLIRRNEGSPMNPVDEIVYEVEMTMSRNSNSATGNN